MNKKVGGYSTGWNHRQTYVRIYDPRNFEFEISVPNLLYILENTNSIKGKGLEGEFVYGWDGTDLILIPTSSPDYEELTKYNEKMFNAENIKAKDLIIGATYLTAKNDEMIYLGKFDYYDDVYVSDGYENVKDYWSSYRQREKYHYENKITGKRHYFCSIDEDGSVDFSELQSISKKFIACTDSECHVQYSELFDKLECSNYHYSPLGEDVYIEYTEKTLQDKIEKEKYFIYIWYLDNGIYKKASFRINENGKLYTSDLTKKYCGYTVEEILEQCVKVFRKDKYLKNGRLYKEGYQY